MDLVKPAVLQLAVNLAKPTGKLSDRAIESNVQKEVSATVKEDSLQYGEHQEDKNRQIHNFVD